MRRVGHNAPPPAPPLTSYTKVSSDGGVTCGSTSAATMPGRVTATVQAEGANPTSNAVTTSTTTTRASPTMSTGTTAVGHHMSSRSTAQPTSRTPMRNTPHHPPQHHHNNNKVHFSVDGEACNETSLAETTQPCSLTTSGAMPPPPPTQTTAVPSAAEQQQCLMQSNNNNNTSSSNSAHHATQMMMMGAAGHGGTRAVSDALNRPAMALSARIMTVYKNINLKFCAERRQQMPGTKYNNGYDDASGHYIPIIGEEIASRYTVQEVLGKGSFGIVLRCCDEKYQEPVAMKIIRSGPYFEAQGALEAEIVAYLNKNPALENRVVQLRKAFIWQGHIALVFELLSFNLYQLIRCTKYNGVSLDLTRKFAYQLLQVLLQLEQHDPPIIHCDLKPENVVLRDPNRSGVRVIDFGSSCYQPVRDWAPPSPVRSLRQEMDQESAAQQHNHSSSSGGGGNAIAEQTQASHAGPASRTARQRYRAMPRYIQSRFYRSPEVILELGYTTAIDRWSLGCMLVELHTGVPLFPGRNEVDMMSRFVAVLGPVPEFMLAVSPKLHTFYDVIHIPTTTTTTNTSGSAMAEGVTGTQAADLPSNAKDNTSGNNKREVAVQAEVGEPMCDEDAPLPHIQTGQRGPRHRHVDPLADSADVTTQKASGSEASPVVAEQDTQCVHQPAAALVANSEKDEAPSHKAAEGDDAAAASVKAEDQNEAAGHAAQPTSQPLSSVGPVSAPSSTSPPPTAATMDTVPDDKAHHTVHSSPTMHASNADSHPHNSADLVVAVATTPSGGAGSSLCAGGHMQVYYALKQGPDPAHVHTLEEIIGVHNGGPRGCRRGQPGHDVTTYLTFLDFIKSLLEYDPRRRMSCAEALRHPFLLPLLELEARATAMHQQQMLQQQQRRKAAAPFESS